MAKGVNSTVEKGLSHVPGLRLCKHELTEQPYYITPQLLIGTGPKLLKMAVQVNFSMLISHLIEPLARDFIHKAASDGRNVG